MNIPRVIKRRSRVKRYNICNEPKYQGYALFRITIVFALVVSLCWHTTAVAAPTNLDLVTETIRQAASSALERMDAMQTEMDWDQPILLKPLGQNDANWLVEHVLADQMLERGFRVSQDSTRVDGAAPILSYRILELGLSSQAGLVGGKVRRYSHLSLALNFSRGSDQTLYWQDEVSAQIQDEVKKKEMELLQHASYKFAKTEVKEQSWGKFVEPVIVTTVLGGLIYLFFSNR